MTRIAVLTSLALFAAPGIALAAGEAQPAAEAPACAAGEAYDASMKKCMKAHAMTPEDQAIYDAGKTQAEAGEYDKAIATLMTVKDQANPKVLNYLGYSHRKSGKVEEGIGYYKKALEIDPDYIRAREYLGEGYVQLKQVDLATAELAEIEKRCGKECEEYKDLAGAIAAAK
jgi:tetratricopeptide (TPR) repeat protein